MGVLNEDPSKGPVRFRALFPPSRGSTPQGRCERLRRVKQIVLGRVPFVQLGGDPLTEFHLAKKNYQPKGLAPRSQLLRGGVV